MSDFDAIKSYLIKTLKDIINTDVFFSENMLSEECWWFVDFRPVALQHTGIFKYETYMVDIAHYKKDADHAYFASVYRALCLKLFEGIDFNQRRITIDETNYNFVDGVSHCTFNISYLPDVEADNGELIENLEIKTN